MVRNNLLSLMAGVVVLIPSVMASADTRTEAGVPRCTGDCVIDPKYEMMREMMAQYGVRKQEVKIIGADDRSYLSEHGERVARPIGQIYCNNGKEAAISTATLVGSSSTVLTAGHSNTVKIKSADGKSHRIVVFKTAVECEFRLYVKNTLVHTSGIQRVFSDFDIHKSPGVHDETDWAVMKLSKPAPRSVGFLDLSISPLGQKVELIAHHHIPGIEDETSKFGQENCSVSLILGARDTSLFRHSCDTNGWSSGGPIFDSITKEIIGINIAQEGQGVPWNLGLRISEPILRALEKALGRPTI